MGLSCTLEDKKGVTSGEGARQSVSDGSNGMCKGPVSGVRNWVKAWLRCRETGQRGTWQDGAVDVTKILRVLRTMDLSLHPPGASFSSKDFSRE